MDDRLEKTWEEVKTHRDELRVQIHLAKAELKDEYEKLEPEFKKAQAKFEELADEAEDKAQELGHAFSVIAEEMAGTYRRIKGRLSED